MSAEPGARASNFDDAAYREHVSGSAFGAFVDTAAYLRLDASEARRLLGDMPSTTYRRYVTAGVRVLGRETLERMSLVFGIVKALRILFVDDESGRRWLHGSNNDLPFAGKSPKVCFGVE